ncbi:MAG: hypothetical protein ACYDH9_19155 [Limisphaerales bacterium]
MNSATVAAPQEKNRPATKPQPGFSPKPAVRRVPQPLAQSSPSPSFSPVPVSPSNRSKVRVNAALKANGNGAH